MKIIKLLLSLFVAQAFLAHADVESIKKDVEKKFPEVKVERVTKTTYGGLYEVFAGSEIFYTDENVSFVMVVGDRGGLVDAQTRNNVTEMRLQKLTAIKFDELPFDQAIKLVRGNGSRRLAIFEDPNCGYCKRFEQDLNKLENITAYIFPYAILADDSVTKSKSIWCSTDRLKAWQDQLMREKAPTAKPTCDNPVEKNFALGQKLRISGTPLTFFEDGERMSGAQPKERFEAKLAEVAAARSASK